MDADAAAKGLLQPSAILAAGEQVRLARPASQSSGQVEGRMALLTLGAHFDLL